MNKINFQISSDPEFVCCDNNGNPKSIIGLLGGTKENPRKVIHGYIQEDNVLAEINPLPANSLEEFIKNQTNSILELKDILKPLNLYISPLSSIEFPVSELNNDKALIGGCDPDINAWTGEVNESPPLHETFLRSAGGHIHVSWPCGLSIMKRLAFVKKADITLGLPAIILGDDIQRKRLYGKAGAFRPKFLNAGHPYNGAELRCLSNFWTKSPELMAFIYKGVEKAFQLEIDNIDMYRDDIETTINTGNVERAYQLCDKFNIDLKEVLS